jgi:hypothetical protein
VSGTSGTILAIGEALRASNTTNVERKEQPAQPVEGRGSLSRLAQLKFGVGHQESSRQTEHLPASRRNEQK